MNRDARLRELSSDHHHALVLARSIARGAMSPEEVQAAYDRSLAPHFALEEEVMLPALSHAGDTELARRTSEEHALLRAHLARSAEDARALQDFAELLVSHVRFEEREVFPAVERLGAVVLDRLAAHHGSRS